MTIVNNKSRTNNKSGFTIIELLVASFMAAIIGISIMTLGSNISVFSSNLTEGIDVQKEIQQTLEFMATEIRPMAPSNTGSYPIEAAASSSLTFYSDVDADGINQRIRYFLDGNIFKKGFLKPTGNPLVYNPVNEIITEMVSGAITASSTPIFSYYDSAYSGSEAAMSFPINVSAVRIIKVTISARHSNQRSPITFTINAMPRNLKTAN